MYAGSIIMINSQRELAMAMKFEFDIIKLAVLCGAHGASEEQLSLQVEVSSKKLSYKFCGR
jgi:hypothetical protein